MIAHQLLIPAENKPGKLAEVTHILAGEKLNIRAITISSFGKEGFLNIIVEDPKAALKALEKAGISVSLKEIIAVLIDDRPGGLDSLAQILADNKINIENAYGFVLESFKQAIFVLDVQEIEKALKLIEKNGFKTLSSEYLSTIEPFHYMKY